MGCRACRPDGDEDDRGGAGRQERRPAGGGAEVAYQGLRPGGGWPVREWRVTVTAIVLRTATPMDPPICMAVLATAAATPASRGSTPR